jgi:hypothetical protein
MTEAKKIPDYPEPSKGPLSADNSKYGVYVQPRGPKIGNPQAKITLFGVIFFVIFTIGMAVFFGITGYL